MAAPAAGKRKRDFCEDDAYLILHPDKHGYTPATILTALQEVAQHAGRRRIDWTALVAKTATGIKSAREYQMLWRYLAYGHDFVQDVDDSAQPLGDESDLECEIEPSPPSSEAAAEASRCAKILIYGSSREQASSHRVNSEVPLLNTPNGKITRLPFDKQLCQSHPLTNGAGPVSNLKQASRTGLSPDPFDGNGPQKKKRKPKPWSKEEDADLMTGVHKCGEGNWLDILHKYSFDNTRSAAELSQRWTLICKRQGTTKPSHAKPVSRKIDMAATQNALYMAVGKTGLSTLRRSVFGTATPELKSAAASSSFPVPVPVPLQVQMPLRQVKQAPDPAGLSNTSNKSRINPKKQVAQTNTTNGPSLIQAAAIAAGGRIATQSAATKLMKAAQSTKAVRARSRGTGSSKTSSSSKSSTMAGESGARLGSGQQPEHPKCSAPTSSPLVLTTQSTEQVNAVPEVTGVNPLEQSASAHLLDTERRMSTTPVSGPCDNTAMDDEVTMEDLFPEDVKESDIVDPKADQEIIDTKDADILDQFDRFVESQQKQLKELPAVGKSIPVSARAPAAVKKAKTLGSTFPPAVTPSGLVGTGNAGVLSKAVWGQPSGPGTTGKQNRCQAIMAQTQQSKNSKSNVIAKNVAPGTRTPARNAPPGVGAPAGNAAPGAGTAARSVAPGAGAPARNVVPGTGPRANRQYNPVVTGARKGNPPPVSK